MARPAKKNADYFSHDADMRNDTKILAVRSKYGLEGYAIRCMLLEKLTDSDDFRVSYSKVDRILIAGDFRIDVEVLVDIVDFFASIGLVTVGDHCISCKRLDERLQQVVDKRERAKQLAEQRKQQKDDTESQNVDDNCDSNETIHVVSVTETPQSKSNKSKGNKSNTTIDSSIGDADASPTPPVDQEDQKKDPLKDRAMEIVGDQSKAAKLEHKKKVADRNTKLVTGIKDILKENGMAYKPDKQFERARANLFFVSKDFAELAGSYNMTPGLFALELCRHATHDKYRGGRVYNTVTLYDNYAAIHNSVKSSWKHKEQQKAKNEEKVSSWKKML